MKAIRIYKPRATEVYDAPEPQIINPDDVKIKVAYAGVCPDEIAFFNKDVNMLAWGPVLFPLTGHEMSGVVVEAGELALEDGFVPGTRVSGYAWYQCGHCFYCRTGKENHCLNLTPSQSTMAEYIVWRSRQLIKIPDSVTLEEACLTDPIGFSMHGIERTQIHIGNSVLIIGGTIPGLILLQLAQMRGAIHLTVIDPYESNLSIAKQLGAEHCINSNQGNIPAQTLQITDKLGYDVIFETTGNLKMLSVSSTLLARGGILAFGSVYGYKVQPPINLAELFIKEAVMTPFHMAPYMLPLVQRIMDKLVLKPLISEVFSMEEATRAYEACESGKYPHVLVRISG